MYFHPARRHVATVLAKILVLSNCLSCKHLHKHVAYDYVRFGVDFHQYEYRERECYSAFTHIAASSTTTTTARDHLRKQTFVIHKYMTISTIFDQSEFWTRQLWSPWWTFGFCSWLNYCYIHHVIRVPVLVTLRSQTMTVSAMILFISLVPLKAHFLFWYEFGTVHFWHTELDFFFWNMRIQSTCVCVFVRVCGCGCTVILNTSTHSTIPHSDGIIICGSITCPAGTDVCIVKKRSTDDLKFINRKSTCLSSNGTWSVVCYVLCMRSVLLTISITNDIYAE